MATCMPVNTGPMKEIFTEPIGTRKPEHFMFGKEWNVAVLEIPLGCC